MRKNVQEQEYISRINRVIDHIEENLGEELNLEKLADVACFSPFHFHRIFAGITGETLNKFIQRIRIEKAAWILRDNPKVTVSDVTYQYGYSSPSVFARAFKERFGMSATEWRELTDREVSKICKAESSNYKDHHIDTPYFADVFDVKFKINKWSVEMKNTKFKTEVTVQELPETVVAYVRHIGQYQGDGNLFERLINSLMKWAGPRGLLNEKTQLMSVYHDNPEITDHEKLRLSVCINVPEDTEVNGEVGKMTVPGGKYAMGRFELGVEDYGDAWKTMYGGWLPESGYQPDDKPAFEIYRNDPHTHPEGKSIVDICIPVRPL